MDRIDLYIDVQRLPPSEVLGTGGGTSSAWLREGVLRAREFARRRSAADGQGPAAAGALAASSIVRSCRLSADDEAFYEDAAQRMGMSGRAIIRTLAVARTIADMEESDRVKRVHLCEALAFRVREGKGVRS